MDDCSIMFHKLELCCQDSEMLVETDNISIINEVHFFNFKGKFESLN